MSKNVPVTKEIRNLDNRLVCRFHEKDQSIEIIYKSCITVIKVLPTGSCSEKHYRRK